MSGSVLSSGDTDEKVPPLEESIMHNKPTTVIINKLRMARKTIIYYKNVVYCVSKSTWNVFCFV